MNTQEQWDKLVAVVQEIVDLAKLQPGVTAVEVGASLSAGLSTNVRLGKVDTIEFNRDKSVGVTVYKDHSKGSVSTTDISSAEIKAAVIAACEIASYTEPDPYNGLAAADQMAQDIVDLKLYHPETISPEAAIDMSMQCEAHALEYSDKINNSEGAGVSFAEGYRVYANSHGFIGHYPSTRYSVSCCVIANENEMMQRDYEYSVNRKYDQLMPLQQVGQGAAQRAIDRLGARKLPTCKAPVLFEASIATGILNSFVRAISGGNLYRKSSFLLDHQGKKVFPEFIQITEDPHLLSGIGSAPFDAEGVATYAKDLVLDGVLNSYVLSSYAARKLNLSTTANAGGVHNVALRAAADKTLSFDELVQQMDRGLIVTEVMGHGVNLVTGDYSKGIFGYWVENGKICYPVQEMTVAGNLAEMFKQLRLVGSDVDERNNLTTGSLLIEEMMIAGN